jgi:predicted ester cyclase
MGAGHHHFTIEDMIVEGNKVVTRATVQGTHKNDFMGIAPTGKQFTMTGIWIYYIADGKIIEDWEVLDQLGMMQQLGAIPPMG